MKMLVVFVLGAWIQLSAQDVPRPAIERIEVLLPADSAGSRMVPVEKLRLPSQRPWQNVFYVAVHLVPGDTSLLRAQAVGLGFDIRMGPQLYGGPDGELLLQDKIDQEGEWFLAGDRVTKELPCSPDCAHRVLFGPFALPSLIPGPREAEALLWPTRLRIRAQTLGIPRAGRGRDAVPASVHKAVSTREIPIN
jgi:hypothetical protein